MRFNYDTEKIIGWLLPASIKKPIQLAWLNALNKPIKFVYARFLEFRILTTQELNKNGQVIVLQRALSQYSQENFGFIPAPPPEIIIGQDNFDYGDGLPTTAIASPSNQIFVEEYPFNVNLPATVKLAEKLISNDIVAVGLISETSTLSSALILETETPYDFQVRVHESLINDLSLKTLRSVVDRYKVLGRTYYISIYS